MKPLNEMTDSERKALPIYEGALAYFPNALCLVAEQSLTGQQQYAPDEPLAWFREKSTDELGSLSRHILDYALAEQRDDYKEMYKATRAIAWRALAHAERFVATVDDDPQRYQLAKALRKEQV